MLMRQPRSTPHRVVCTGVSEPVNAGGPTLLCSKPVGKSLSSCSTSAGGDSPRAQVLPLPCEERCAAISPAKDADGSLSTRVVFRRLSRGGVETLEIPNLEMLAAAGYLHHQTDDDEDVMSEDDMMSEDDIKSEDETEDRLQMQKCTKVLGMILQFVQQVFDVMRSQSIVVIGVPAVLLSR